MPLTYSNTLGNALNNKANPKPLGSLTSAVNSLQEYASGQGNPTVNRSANTLSNFSRQAPGAITSAQNTLQGFATTPNRGVETARQGLQGIASNLSPEVAQANADYNSFAQSSPYMTAAQFNPNVAASVAQGRGALLGQTFGQILNAKQNAVSNALTGQGQQIQAGGAAGNLAATGQGQQMTAAESAGSLGQNLFNSQIGAAQSAGSLAQGQQNAQIGAAQNVGALTTPAQNGYVLIDKTTGKPLPLEGTEGNSAITQGGLYNAQAQGAESYGLGTQAIAGAQNQINSITSLINNANLNQFGINVGNATIQEIQKHLSSSDYATLQNGLKAIDAELSKITGAPVDVEQLSRQRGTSLITTLNNQLQLAKAANDARLTNKGTQSGGNNKVEFNTDGTLKAVDF